MLLNNIVVFIVNSLIALIFIPITTILYIFSKEFASPRGMFREYWTKTFVYHSYLVL